jgi:tight adherence protein B
MEPIIAIVVGIGFFLVIALLLPKFIAADASKRTRGIIDKIAAGASENVGNPSNLPPDDEQVVSSFKADAKGIAKLLISLPKAEDFYLLMVKAGYGNRAQSVLWGIVALFVGASFLLSSMFGILGIPIAALIAFILPKKYLKMSIERRNRQFLDMFPEAIDMIIRSVKSGHPLNTALRMIADNIDEPVGPEFRQVVNEIAFGRPLVEALRRLAKRIDEQDIHFFVVVLSVQQETGGNLAEILGNLSNVIRGRKRLNQKIRAMTSEGRATGWVLGALPIIQILAIQLSSPKYLEPLFTTTMGNILFMVAMGLIVTALWIVSRMIKIDI